MKDKSSIFYAVKTPKGNILTFTISENSREAKRKATDVEKVGWIVYKNRGFTIVRGRFVQEAK